MVATSMAPKVAKAGRIPHSIALMVLPVVVAVVVETITTIQMAPPVAMAEHMAVVLVVAAWAVVELVRKVRRERLARVYS